jgi:tetratricopeptide (TPR) repeat protein
MRLAGLKAELSDRSCSCVVALLLVLSFSSAFSADFSTARELFQQGAYAECIKAAEEGARRQDYNEEWRLLLIEALLTTGRYADAYEALTNSLDRFRTSLRLRLLGREVLLFNGKDEEAQTQLEEVTYLISTRNWYYRDPASLLAVGKTALLIGADPRKVLDESFERARKADPSLRDAYLASGQLALDKHDYKLAARTFTDAVKRFPKDADFHYGLARAYEPTDRRQMVESIEQALEHNTNHVPSFLLLADNLIDGERYEDAEKELTRALAVNPSQPDAWAYRAVIAHLEHNLGMEQTTRSNALRHWKTNPNVDHLIGRKLSQKYRFAEGAAQQRRALRLDPRFLPARIQLAQDLLRLGQEEEGWKLASEVHEQDAYDVTAYNLATLQETLSKFHTLTNKDFVLRMGTNEAPVYGEDALGLLQRARTHLCAKYGLTPEEQTIVEIFPNQKDFAVRTFGMPGNPGYLGVCFGRVITANSPASQGAHPANWQAVLWHEFCHVVTLQLTKNKMPRWLSEGISVYEERLANPSWGQRMTPQYREMILGEGLVPVGELSSAFLTAKSDLQLQFAYYESSLVVEFLVEQYGFDSVKKILGSLAEGVPINDAIAAHSAPLEKIEEQFAAWARQRAENLAPDLDFEKPERGSLITDEVAGSKASNFYLLTRHIDKLVSEKKWAEAKGPAERLLKAFPDHIGPGNAYESLAEIYRGLGDTSAERAVLAKLAELDADAFDTFVRLTTLAADVQDWPSARLNAERSLAVNPLVAAPHRHLAQAHEALGDADRALRAWKKLLFLNPPDPAEAHFHVAALLHQKNDPDAKRYVLQALEEAPRFREAHRLLLRMNGAEETTPTPQ